MAILDLDEGQRKILLGVGVGLGVTVFVKALAPAFAGMGRPLTKAFIRSGLQGAEAGREKWAHLRETWEDLVAEVRAEMELRVEPPAAAEPPSATTTEES